MKKFLKIIIICIIFIVLLFVGYAYKDSFVSHDIENENIYTNESLSSNPEVPVENTSATNIENAVANQTSNNENTVASTNQALENIVQETQTNTIPENVTTSEAKEESKNEIEYYKGYEVAGHLKIPKYKIDAPIFKSMNMQTLNISVGVAYGTLNEVGNTTIFGHGYENYPFSVLGNIKIGDKVIITDSNKKEITYEVYDKQVISNNDASYMLRDTAGAREITMQTGHSDSKRLIVSAKEVSK